MHKAWNKGLSKTNNSSVRKISETMKKRKVDNFSVWRKKMMVMGKIKAEYPSLKKNGDLAELIGVTLGDGHICVYPRSEELRIISNANNPGFVQRYSKIIEKVFGKKPYTRSYSNSKSVRIGFYEKYISKRLGVPTGDRGKAINKIPDWILADKKYILRYLRGLYEAEGSFCVHKPTYTHKFLFSGANSSMIKNVHFLMTKLGFHPHISTNQVQISRKEEVYKAMKLLKFRKY